MSKNQPSTSDGLPLAWNPQHTHAFRLAVRKWSQQHPRELPWRAIGDPYRVWVSEIMLQQTTVTAVIPYYERFLKHFPDVQSLAAAEESEVLRLWEGLGYYSRARNLHRGAQRVVAQFQSQFPRDVETLQGLPGIGRYTAGAIASFAFDQRAPIVEANTLRLYSRLLGYAGDPRSAYGQACLWQFAEQILPSKLPGQFNQALMDLGATVCTPADPHCAACPLKKWCQAFIQGRVSEIPQRAIRPEITNLTAFAVAIRKSKKYLLRKCQPGERWAGLWDFPRLELETEQLPHGLIGTHLTRWITEQIGLTVELGVQLAEFRHSVTRYRITLHCYLAEFRQGRLPKQGDWQWVSGENFADYPLSVTGRKYAQRLQACIL